MFSYSKFVHTYTKSEFNYKEPVSQDYKVFVNGEEVPVYTCRISAYPFNCWWTGEQRQADQTELASFVNLVSDEKLNIEIEILNPVQRVRIKPYSKNIIPEMKGNRASFTLEENGQFVFQNGSYHHCLYIFNTKPIECEDKNSVTYYFGPGVHMPGKITLKDNESVYLDKDALVFGCIFAENAKNIRIYGNGLMDDSGEGRFCEHCYESYTNGNVKFYDCENVSIEGVLLRNSAIWCVNIFHCFDFVLDNVKVFGQWRYNTDGVDIINSKNVTIKNSFIHSFDDTVTIKGIDRYIDTDNENIITENCVLWCDWGKCCEIGFETACRRYKNIVFRNCDILRGGDNALDINNGDCAEVSDVIFENINVEYNSFDTPEVLQESADMKYNAKDKIFVPNLLRISNDRFRKAYDFLLENTPPYLLPEFDYRGAKFACVHDITVKNINVYCDEEIPKKDGNYDIRIVLESILEDVEHYNINISGITVNGEKINKDNAVITAVGVKNYNWEE